ncbi:MAG: hypothetical protein PF436_11820 [Prolixibacteraceae bacterium]|jgi:hypothetical protein|nr:hypothetical protein [Prolixibacteraceae bacterium]
MRRVKYIVNIFALTVLLLIVGNSYVFAQNTYDQPYLDSWHKYRVPMGDVANTPTWQLQINSGAEIALTNDMYEAGDGEIWVKYGTEDVAGADYAYIELKFIDPRFDIGDVATIIYSEMDLDEGNCEARRSKLATVVNNQFELNMTDMGNICNSFNGIWDNTTEFIGDADHNHEVEFNVSMTKEEGFRASSWRFTGTFSIESGAGDNSFVSPITVSGNNQTAEYADNGATWSILNDGNPNDNTITIEVNVADPDFVYTTDNLTFSVLLNGKVSSDVTVQFTLDEGYGVSGTNYPSEVSDANNGDTRFDQRIINGKPNTLQIVSVP